jgi:uncharacterized protein (UPF0303 family)
MDDVEKNLQIIDEQERLLQFESFDSETALQIGLSLIKKAKDENQAITIDITKAGHQLFHYAFSGTSPDNDQWVKRKNAVVNRFYRSSLYIGLSLKKENLNFEERYNLSLFDYAPAGGAFPIMIKNVGVVGTITVSGLTQEEDHDVVVWAITEYLK